MTTLHTPRLLLLQLLVVATLSSLAACTPSLDDDDDDDDDSGPAYNADPEFDDPLRYLYAGLASESDAELAFGLRALAELAGTLDLEAASAQDRALRPDPLRPEDLEDIDRPDRDPSGTLNVLVAKGSDLPPTGHEPLLLLVDRTEVDPSTSTSERAFLDDSAACWPQDCDLLEFQDTITRENLLFVMDLVTRGQARRVDVALPDPSTVEVGEEPTNPGDPAWGYLSRSWLPETTTSGDGSTTARQEFSLRAWLPSNNGAVRVTAVWTEIELPVEVTEEIIVNIAISGVEDTFEAEDDWLEAR